jgi:threonylcarbamoyladenosine tRNA methylthiotransferase MtaB
VQKLRSEIKDIAITTDIIVGFPGETGEDFNKTLEFLKEVRPSRTHIFTFSRRRGTAAFDMPTDIDQATVENRYHRLNVAAIGSSYLYRSKYIGRDLDILVESRRARHSGLLTGYSGNYIRVVFEGPDSLMGRIVPVTVTDVNLAGTFGIYRAV